jgi:UDP-3-O-[3-hydroxymyristoyl] glucosamine N-acyltransferase
MSEPRAFAGEAGTGSPPGDATKQSAGGTAQTGPGLTVGEIAAMTGATAHTPAVAGGRCMVDVAALDRAAPWDLSFLDNERLAAAAANTRAGACFVTKALAAHLPRRVVALEVDEPFGAFVMAARALFAQGLQPSSLYPAGASLGAHVHPDARLEAGVTIEPGAVVGPDAEIGSGTVIAANATVGGGVCIGRNCTIGAGATLGHALIGDRVVIHAGCHIGEEAFGFVAHERGRPRMPPRGRVIIQDGVEIGAGTTIDRGGISDTVVGEGSKIDNLVRVGHNASIGRHCLVVAQSGISGGAAVEDNVVLEARVGLEDDVTVGEGARIAAASVVARAVPAGAYWAGVPAGPAEPGSSETKGPDHLTRGPSGTAAIRGE